MWFPLTPDQLQGYEEKVDYIVITEYKVGDSDFELGEWSEVVARPNAIENQFLSDNYTPLHTFTINSEQTYENITVHGTIFIRSDLITN